MQFQEDFGSPSHVALDTFATKATLQRYLVHPVCAEEGFDVVPEREVLALRGDHEYKDAVVRGSALVRVVELIEKLDVHQVARLGSS
ncbi:hypothetical protein GCM10027344_37110 [Spelaeicoccus albus]